jgi:hypothetical protein
VSKALSRETAREHPIVGVLIEDGRTQTWLARRTGYSAEYLNRVLKGHLPALPAFRAKCALRLGMPESALFHGGDVDHGASGAPHGEANGRAGTAGTASYTTRAADTTGGAAAD